VVVISNLAQAIVTRFGVRVTLTAGLLTTALSVALLAPLPLHGHYFWGLFPGFVLGGAGIGLSFVAVTIAGLTGVPRSDAGIASGLINTSRQIGGAIGIAGATAIASAATNHVAGTAALDHGFRVALVVMTGVLLVGAAVAAGFVRPVPAAGPAVVPPVLDPLPLEEAA
jgi:MFS family permease